MKRRTTTTLLPSFAVFCRLSPFFAVIFPARNGARVIADEFLLLKVGESCINYQLRLSHLYNVFKVFKLVYVGVV